jgi:glucose-6-phosphate isomerase
MLNTQYFMSNSDEGLFERIEQETKRIGYYKLPEQNLDYLKKYLEKLDIKQCLESITDIVVVGIGGSSLGAKAIYNFLDPLNTLARNLHFIDSTDPVAINGCCQKLDLNTSHFLIISKSGKTLETIAIYKYLRGITANNSQNTTPFTFITDKDSPLEAHASEIDGLVVNIQENVGGRFSVLSSVGIIPLALAGINVKELLQGANKTKQSFFEAGHMQNALLKKATFYAKNSTTYNINAVFSYAESLQSFNQWYAQLWGESLGKRQLNSAFNVGQTPIGLTGPKDQHSFLQLLIEGTRNKTVTFIKMAHFEDSLTIPSIKLKNLESLDIINGVHFSNLINTQADAIIESLRQSERIPLDEIIIDQQNAFSIGQLIYYFELLTSLVGDLLNINTYDQPGVESGKNILMEKLKNNV